MGLSVKTVAAGGLAVVETTRGTPVTESPNAYGVSVTKVVGKPYGLPVTFETIGVAAPFVGVTFDPGNLTSVVLSNGNLKAMQATANANSGVRATKYYNAGKYYIEFTTVAAVGSFNAVGFMLSVATYLNFGVNGTDCIAFSKGGNININGSSAGVNIGSFATPGDVCCIGIDFGTHLVWGRKGAAGLWNASGAANPATGFGGIAFAIGPLVPAVCFVGSSPVTDGFIANFGSSAFSGAVPSGFTPGWPA